MLEFSRPPREPDLEVELHLLPTESGGRAEAPLQGYRVPHDFGLPGEMNDGLYEFTGEPPAPGASQRAFVWLLAPDRNYGRFEPGFEFSIWEGRNIGTGRIICVLNAALAIAAQQVAPADGFAAR
ncbi:hypothetical protein [Comamonas serinivorans]|uniref:hypothetical protein n=1 Tax=Comamonas serinivorans TaxID=1082851 RepID=UPI0012F96897|nr:hypothetical protein [Comamonas serinivorans]